MSQQREQVRTESQPVGAFSLTALRDTPRYTYLVAAVAALGGMLFGYDIGVISGAENLLKASFRLSSGTEGAGRRRCADRRGDRRPHRRRAGRQVQPPPHTDRDGPAVRGGRHPHRALVQPGLLPGVPDHHRHRRRRLLGAGVPAYIAEMSPARIRGGLVVLQQLAISAGILISYVLDFAFDSAGWGWRPMFGFAVVPAAALTAGMLAMSSPPGGWAYQDRWDEASEVLSRVNPQHQQQDLEMLHSEVRESAGTSWRELLRPGLRGALIAGVGLAIFQQLVGPNTVLFYTPTIFGYAGIGGNSPASDDLRRGRAVHLRVPHHRHRRCSRPQGPVLLRAARHGIDARAARLGVRGRAEELGHRRAPPSCWSTWPVTPCRYRRCSG